MRKSQKSSLILISILALLALVGSWLYLFPNGLTANAYILDLRIKKLLVFLLLALIASFSTISFQSVTENRFLTPSVLGLESLYVLMQSVYLFFFYNWSQGQTPRSLPEFLLVLAMQCSFFLVLQPVFRKLMAKDLGIILLVCMALGTLFRSLATFFQVLMDPNEYDKLQSRLFASLQSANQDILWLVLPLVLILLAVLFVKGRVLDTFYLGKDGARLLGVAVEREQRLVLWLVVILVAISTALVGPLSFLGFILANLTYRLVPDFAHRSLFLVGSLLGFLLLLASQVLVERVFNFNVNLSGLVELGGGIFFFYLLYKERRSL